MSACTRYPDDDVVLRYVASDLPEPDLSAFEDHLFACDDCLARVERCQAAQQVLAARELPAMPTIVASTGSTSSARQSQTMPWWILGAMAASLVMVAGGLWSWQRGPTATPQPTPMAQVAPPAYRSPATGAVATSASAGSSTALQVAVLAMVTPPPYLPITTRGESSTARFDEAMRAYTRGEWATASRALIDVETAEARFYQGVADLMRGDAASATTTLEAARDSGVQPYARESLFYLGKAALQRGDVVRARGAFVAARQAGASMARESTRLLEALDEAASGK